MSDFEMLSIVLMILGIVVTLVIAYVQGTKKESPRPRKRLLFYKVKLFLGQPSYRQALFFYLYGTTFRGICQRSGRGASGSLVWAVWKRWRVALSVA